MGIQIQLNMLWEYYTQSIELLNHQMHSGSPAALHMSTSKPKTWQQYREVLHSKSRSFWHRINHHYLKQCK